MPSAFLVPGAGARWTQDWQLHLSTTLAGLGFVTFCLADDVVEPYPGLPIFGVFAHLANSHPFYKIANHDANNFPYIMYTKEDRPVLTRYIDHKQIIPQSEYTISPVVALGKTRAAGLMACDAILGLDQSYGPGGLAVQGACACACALHGECGAADSAARAQTTTTYIHRSHAAQGPVLRPRKKKREEESKKKKERRKKDSPAFDLLCRSVRVVDDAPEAVLAVLAVLAVAVVRAPVLQAY